MIALIDADIVVYQSAANAETITDWGGDDVQVTGSKSETEESIDSLIHDLKKVTSADRVLLAFSSDTNFRKDVYEKYKSNRKGTRKPATFAHGKAYAKKKYDSMTREGLEADDLLGILATGNVKAFRGPKVVCSIDKDMRTFPCSLYNWRKPDDGVVEIDEVEADYAFYEQILTGDATDGYPGCPGIGPKRAERIIDEHFDYWCSVDEPSGHSFDGVAAWAAIVAAYKKKDLTEAEALTQARCARILRATDYNFKIKSLILWTPPKGEEDGTD